MSRLLVCLILAVGAHPSYAIHFFEGTYQQALSTSQTEHKRVLLYFTARWCGPCRYMEKNVFHTDSVTSLTDQQFIALKLDYDAGATKALLDQYKVGGLPTFLVISAQQVVERQVSGLLSVSQLVAFLDCHWQPSLQRAAQTQIAQLRYEKQKREQAQWKVELGGQAGLNLMHTAPLAPHQKVGYELGLLVAFTYRRLSLRPGLSLVSVGGKLDDQQVLALHYVALPLTLAYVLRRTALLGLPGGYRAHLTPYVAKLLNNPNGAVSALDYGSKLGLSAFIGQTSQLEAQVGYQLGVHDVGRSTNSGLYNRGLYGTVSFIF